MYYKMADVKKYLKIMGMSQKELAEKMGIGISKISDWLNGNRNMPRTYELKLCEALGIESIDYLKDINDFVPIITDLSIIEIYLKIIGMSNNELAAKMKINQSIIPKLINNQHQIIKEYEKKLFEALGIKSIEEIRDRLDKFIKEYTKIIDDLKERFISNKLVDITVIRPYLIKFGISIEDLSFDLNSNHSFISECLNGKKQMPREKVLILLKVLEQYIEKKDKGEYIIE